MAKLYIEGKDKSYLIGNQPIIIGRSSKCDVAISDSHFSRHHFEIGKNDGSYYVKDLNSYNGTFINDKKITQHELKNNDRIVVGKVSFTFHLDENDASDGSEIKSTCFLLIGDPKQWKHKATLSIGNNTIGRKKGNMISFHDDQMSSHHAEIHVETGRYKVKDLGSRNGTLLNYKRIEGNRNYSINDGDLLQFGSTFTMFKDGSVTVKKAVIKKKKWSHVLLPAISILLFTSVFVGIYFVQNSYQEHFVPGNVLENFSFEDENSWEYKGEATRVEGENAHSGNFFAHLQNTASIKYWEQITVDYGKNYLVSCWARSQKQQGKSGIKLQWECGETSYNIKRYIVFPQSSIEEWQKYDYVVIPPTDAKSFQVAIVLEGKENEYLDIDNFTIIGTNENGSPSNTKKMEYQKLKVEMDMCGKIDVYRNKDLIIGNAQFRVWSANAVLVDQYFENGNVNINGRNISWQKTAEAKDNEKYRTEVRTEKDGFTIDIHLPKSLVVTDGYLEYFFNIPISYTTEVHLIRANDIVVANIDNLSQEEVNQIVWRNEQLGIIYNDNVQCTISSKNNSLLLQQKFYNLENNKVSIKIKTDYSEDQKQLEILKNTAVAEEKLGNLGKSYKTYREMLGNSFVYGENISPQIEMQRLLKKYNEDEKVAWESLETAQFFGSPILYDKCLEHCKNIIKTWESIDLKKMHQIIQTAENEKNNLLLQQNIKKTEPLVAHAKKLEEEGQSAIALMYYKEASLLMLDTQQKQEIEMRISELSKNILERD